MAAVAIVDYGLCNLDSMARAVEECGGRPRVTDDPDGVASADRIILPGVGAFPDAMRNLRSRGLDQAMEARVRAGVPLLGVCLGMQLLASRGSEVASSEGLGWIEGEVRRLEPTNGERVPHVGWNEVKSERDCPLLAGIEFGRDFYFVHSYHLACADAADVAARTDYCGGIASVVGHGNVFGTQFHPEKSQRVGFQLLRNFLALS